MYSSHSLIGIRSELSLYKWFSSRDTSKDESTYHYTICCIIVAQRLEFEFVAFGSTAKLQKVSALTVT